MKNNEKILITGGTGLLGQSLIKSSQNHIRTVYLGDYEVKNEPNVEYIKCNICDPDFDVKVLDDYNPDVIIHTAGIANVDACEKDSENARISNVDGTRNMVDICKKYNSYMVYISTNAVYDGENPPYSETDPVNPVNVYGKLKVACEEIINQSEINSVIVRPIIMYGWNLPQERGNPVTWIIDQLKDSKEIFMVNDVYENPLFVDQASEAIWKIIELKAKGIYNLAGKDVINRFEFALAVAEIFDLPTALIKDVSSDYFSTIAKRPKQTYYNTNKMEQELNIKPIEFKQGLKIMKEQMK